MRDILRLNAELQASATEEMETILSERAVFNSILENRARELNATLENELRRIEAWAEQQKQMIKDTFSAMLAENQADIERNDALVQRIGGEVQGRTPSQPPSPVTIRPQKLQLRTISKAAAAFAKAAE